MSTIKAADNELLQDLVRKSSLEKLNNNRDKTEAWKEILDKFNSITEENLSMKQIQKKWNNFKTNQKKKNSDKDFDDEVKTGALKTFGKPIQRHANHKDLQIDTKKDNILGDFMVDVVDAPLEPIESIGRSEDVQSYNSRMEDEIVPNVIAKSTIFSPNSFSSSTNKTKSSDILKRKLPPSTSLQKLHRNISNSGQKNFKKTHQNDDKLGLDSQLTKNMVSIQKITKFQDHDLSKHSKIPEKKLSKINLKENIKNPDELRAQEIHEFQLRINKIQEEEARFKLELEKTIGFYKVQEAKNRAIKSGYIPSKNDPVLLDTDFNISSSHNSVLYDKETMFL